MHGHGSNTVCPSLCPSHHPLLLRLLLLLLSAAAPSPSLACDPAQSWLAYAVARGDGRAVTNATVSFTVPSLPAHHGGIGAFWWGLEPAPACDLMQPVLALGRITQGNVTAASWSIFNERFDWLDSSKSFTTKPKAVAPGARVTSNIHTSGSRYRMSIGPVVDYQSQYTYSYMDTEPNKTYALLLAPYRAMEKKIDCVYLIATMPGTCIGVDTSSQSQENCRAIVFIFPCVRYSDVYVVVEHQPERCSQFPASGAITFDHIAIELEGERVAPRWEVLQGSEHRCGCTAEAVDAATVKFTWTTTDAEEGAEGAEGRKGVLPPERR